MSKYLTKSVAATISALLLLGCAAPAFAADATVEKKETSYLILNADGSVQEQITSDWLHSDDGFDAVTDESDLPIYGSVQDDGNETAIAYADPIDHVRRPEPLRLRR